MTGRETLHMFGLLRGIPRQNLVGKMCPLLSFYFYICFLQIFLTRNNLSVFSLLLEQEAAVEDLLCALTLSKHADQITRTYSGGNKRKLSLGVALIGSPDVILIDESSSGMDPYARRKIWDLISEVAETRMVVLTTHSMEEAEALCTRLTIMVDGKMKCIGSVQHLKSKYLGGYTLDLQLQSTATATILETVKRHILEIALPSSLLVEEHGLFLRFSIPSLNSEGVSLSLGSIFSSLEAMKSDESMLLQEYSIAQSTLEQVFINLTKEG
jgi:ATP-binding cassette subfamily A (ABC1) protein 3